MYNKPINKWHEAVGLDDMITMLHFGYNIRTR